MDRPVAMKSNLHSVLFETTTTRFWVANASKDGKPAAKQPYSAFRLGELLEHRPDPSATALPPRPAAAVRRRGLALIVGSSPADHGSCWGRTVLARSARPAVREGGSIVRTPAKGPSPEGLGTGRDAHSDASDRGASDRGLGACRRDRRRGQGDPPADRRGVQRPSRAPKAHTIDGWDEKVSPLCRPWLDEQHKRGRIIPCMDQFYRCKETCVFLIHYHVVFCPKRRRKILVGPIRDRLMQIVWETAPDLECDVLALEVMPDHVHFLWR